MNQIRSALGLEASELSKNVILIPFLAKGFLTALGIDSLTKKSLYAYAQHKDFTLIQTGVGASLAGDAVMLLKNSPAKNIFFFGTCGLVQPMAKLNIGSLVTVKNCFLEESFSQIASGRLELHKAAKPDPSLTEFLECADAKNPVYGVRCLTFGSLALEEDFLDDFKRKKIEVIEMECSAVFSAAQKISVPACALLSITDILKEKPIYKKRSSSDQEKINQSIQRAAQILKQAIKNKA